MDDQTLSEVNKNLNLILKQFYELHERVNELEKDQVNTNRIVCGAIILVLIGFGGVLWLVL